MAHHVLSEVERELAQQYAASARGDDNVLAIVLANSIHVTTHLLTFFLQSEFAIFELSMRRSVDNKCHEDSDGDLDVPRRNVKKRRRYATGNCMGDNESSSASSDIGDVSTDCQTYAIEVNRSAMSWDTAGSQLWRAAFLLAEYIHTNSQFFISQTVMELGCGIGFASIVASQFAKLVFATDADTTTLQLAQRNVDRNHFGDVRTRVFDWDKELVDAAHDTPERFLWTQEDRAMAQSTSVVIASDVFYDDETTATFLKALYNLMLDNPRLTAVIALEKRVVFSAFTMSTISLGFDTFQEHLCPHESLKHNSKRGVANQVSCEHCCKDDDSPGANTMKFLACRVSIDDIPHTFGYERLSTLMLWKVEAIVAPANPAPADTTERQQRRELCVNMELMR